MISWIQRTFQKHFKLVIFLLIAVMGIPMIFIYSASGGLGYDRRRGKSYTLFGHTWDPGPEKDALERNAQASARLTGNQILGSLEGRAALRHLADQLGIPQPTDEQFKDYLRAMPIFQGADGQFDAQRYTQFSDGLRSGAMFGMSEAQILHVFMENCRLEQVQKALFGPGFAPDADVKRYFEDRDTTWSVEVATIDLSSVQASAEPTEEELRRYFEISPAQFETPARVEVDYVEFKNAEYLAGLEAPRDEEILAHFERNKSRFQKPAPAPAADGTTPAPTETTLADPGVRDQVIADLTQTRAAARAIGAAADFAAAVDEDHRPGTPAFDALVAQHKLTIKSAPPFSDRELPPGLAWTPTIVNAAFKLGELNPVSDAVRAIDSAVVLIYRGRLAPAPASFESVRERVATIVRANMRSAAKSARGSELERQLSAAVASGKSFADAAKAAGMEVKSWEKFKRTAPPPDLDPAVYQAFTSGKERTVGQAQITGEKCSFVYVTAKVAPEASTASAEYAEARAGMMEQSAQVAGGIALVEAIKAEKARAGLTEPGADDDATP